MLDPVEDDGADFGVIPNNPPVVPDVAGPEASGDAPLSLGAEESLQKNPTVDELTTATNDIELS